MHKLKGTVGLWENLYCVPFGSFWFANTGQQNRQKNCGDSLPLKWSYSPDFGSSSNTLYSFCSQGSTDQKNQIFFFSSIKWKWKKKEIVSTFFCLVVTPGLPPLPPVWRAFWLFHASLLEGAVNGYQKMNHSSQSFVLSSGVWMGSWVACERSYFTVLRRKGPPRQTVHVFCSERRLFPFVL